MSRRARLLTAMAALGLAVVVQACRQVVGITDDPPEALTTTACGLPYGTPACASCANGGCCDESAACEADPACAPYASCFYKCDGDPTCWSTCTSDYPANTPAINALSACMVSKCETPCKLTCGGFPGRIVPAGAATACEECLTAKACEPMRTCARLASCDAARRCGLVCATFDCGEDCQAADGADPARTYEPDGGSAGILGASFDAEGKCGPACGYGKEWACVGKVSWPSLKFRATPYTYHFWVKDYSSGAPVPDAGVSVCAPTDSQCSMSFANGVTDTNGAVALRFQNVSAGGQQGDGLDGYLSLTGPDLFPVHYYWGFPLSGTEVFTYTQVVTNTELQGLLGNIHVVQDSARGFLNVATYDCQYSPASGVEITLTPSDPLTQSFTVGGTASTTTDYTGFLVFTNVPAGFVQVSARPQGLNKVSSTESVAVYPGVETQLLMFPTP